MRTKKIKTALISVFHKEGLGEIIKKLDSLNVEIISTGGTQKYIENLGVKVKPVENLTSYPSILDGRVKTLHPKIFGGILARSEESHNNQLQRYEIPKIDLVIVDLYPFEKTVANTNDEDKIIEKIDIGGIALIRAAAKNFEDVVVIPSQNEYGDLLNLLHENSGYSNLDDRKKFAAKAFMISSHYDTAIFNYFNKENEKPVFKKSIHKAEILRYGENPHQKGIFYGDLNEKFEKLNGKPLSFNNLVDIDAAIQVIDEFKNSKPTFAIIKHTNTCGLATRSTVLGAWKAALEGDNISAFGGIFACNDEIDLATAQEIDKLFYEVVLAPDFSDEAQEFLSKKKKRVLLKIKDFGISEKTFKRVLNGVVEQDSDLKTENENDLTFITNKKPEKNQIKDLLFANIAVKHLKSNAIVLVKNEQLIGMGAGQTSRIEALIQAIAKAKNFGFSTDDAVLGSDAFFPFADSVELAHRAGITAVIQPGGSIRDNDSIDFCDKHEMTMVFTGIRHFRH